MGLTARGYDGNPFTGEISEGDCEWADLSTNITHRKDMNVGKNILPGNVSVSIEVGEHLPVKFEQQFLDNVVYAGPSMVIMSWHARNESTPEGVQEGDGHFNERPHEYIEEQMRNRG